MTIDKYYLAVVMKALIGILRDSSLSVLHMKASTVAITIVNNLGFEALPQLEVYLNTIIYRFYKNNIKIT